ncbi:hypothetical protein LJR219_000955 [Phenylobacterium sp. LjRoot219]|uniref:hypothetical protein n=1 Tax=Phenylobacterium sp. LjRoot219 TaxID=3342283 RepID=UPI003ECD77FE
MKSPSKPVRRGSPAASFRTQIEKAEVAGCARGDMTLRLTLGDASLLKRDPALAVTDITFADGAMTFLGVPIQEGGVTESKLVVAKAADGE